jgi:hypothetical protein
VPGEVDVIESVEQPAVEDCVKGLAERVEAQRVEHLENGLDPTLSGLAPGDLNRARGDIDAEGDGAAVRGQDRVFTGPAAASSRAPVGVPKSARRRNAGCGRPMSQGGAGSL